MDEHAWDITGPSIDGWLTLYGTRQPGRVVTGSPRTFGRILGRPPAEFTDTDDALDRGRYMNTSHDPKRPLRPLRIAQFRCYGRPEPRYSRPSTDRSPLE